MPNDSEDYVGRAVSVGLTYTKRGDIASYDLTQASMVMDNALHDWDISGIVPAGTKLVSVGAAMADSTIGLFLVLTFKGYENLVNADWLYNAVTNKTVYNNFLIPVDPDVLILSYATSPAAIDIIFMYVAGWWT